MHACIAKALLDLLDSRIELDLGIGQAKVPDTLLGVRFRTNIPGGLKSEINVYSRAGNMCTRPQEGQTAQREACSSAHLPRSEKSEIREFAQPRVFPFPQGGAWRSCPAYVDCGTGIGAAPAGMRNVSKGFGRAH